MNVWLHTIMNNYPDCLPFACLVTGKLTRKPFVTRVVEALITAAVAAVGGGYLVLSIATAHIEEKQAALDQRLTEHISDSSATEKNIMKKLDTIQDCMMRRCNK